MNIYSEFAEVYDIFMDNVPYEEWCKYIISLLKDYDITDGLCLDLGCGTGKLTELMAKNGFDMIGVDNSDEMLNMAINRKYGNDSSTLYLNQDMRSFELYGTVKAVISICDCINYITEENDLLQVFKLVNNYLDPGGIFIFDLNTYYKYHTIGDSVIAENREDCSFIWENNFYEEDKINEYNLTLFIKEDNDMYHKFTETHYQRAYPLEKIKELLEKAGLEFVTCYDAFTRDDPKSDSERLYIIAKEIKKSAE